ncbi:hypothetical protein V8J84_13940 [Yoonia sp. 208BN28-4]
MRDVAEPVALEDGFNTPASDGTFPIALTSIQRGSIPGQYAYQTGFEQDVGMRVFAGLMPDAVVSGSVGGSAIFDARYQGSRTSEIAITPATTPGGDPILTGTSGAFSGDITLTVDMAGTALTGSDGLLAVNGQIDGQTLAGTVTYRGLDGSLTGLIGEDEAIGAFFATSDTTIYAGGFAGKAR